MLEYIRRVGTEFVKFLKAQSPMRIVAMTVTGIGIVAVMVMLFIWAGEKTYVPLMTNLNPDDAANIIRILREKHIPFEVDPSGRNIDVPPESLYEFRLELATMGLPQSSVVGYEVFNGQNLLGTSSFVQKINQKRALEGELMRTINSIRGVHRSRVHLAIPEKSTFVEDQKRSTASVVLDLDPGIVPTEKQIYGIGNLVAHSVEGLEPADVVIVDANGKTLSKNPSDPLTAATASQLDFQEKLEADLEKRIENILGRVVGEGHVVAKVTADLDFSQVNETQTLVDADGEAIVSVERKNDTMNGTRPGPYGLSGAASNAPGQPPPANGDVRSETTKNNEVINYQVPQTVRRTTRPTGSIRRLSVAVVVDGQQVRAPASSGQSQTRNAALSADQLKQFEDIVASAAGIDRKRGDTLEVKNMEFSHEDFEEAQRVVAEKERRSYIQNMALYGVIGLVVVLFFFFVVKPFIKWITENTIESVDTFLPQTIEELERLQKDGSLASLEDSVPQTGDNLDPEKVEGEMIKEKITSLVETNPHKAALILKDWLHEAPIKKEESQGAKTG